MHLPNNLPDTIAPMTLSSTSLFSPLDTTSQATTAHDRPESDPLDNSDTCSAFSDDLSRPSTILAQRCRGPLKSTHFSTPGVLKHKKSSIPFPPLLSPSFGLIQEELTHEPFWLIIATIFLTLTKGTSAIPIFRLVKARWPSPELLAEADEHEMFDMMKTLGLYKRIGQCVSLAKRWVANPPERGRRYRVLHYPQKGDGKEIKIHEVLGDDDERSGAWEIGHLIKGRYALDSWRIFCRDIFRGKLGEWDDVSWRVSLNMDEEAQFSPPTLPFKKTNSHTPPPKTWHSPSIPEWQKVLPHDKELRAILRWMWLKEGYLFNVETGEKVVASEEMMRAALEGRIEWDENADAGMMILKDGNEANMFEGRKAAEECIWKRWRALARVKEGEKT